MTGFEKLKACLTEIGIPFTTTDDSQERLESEELGDGPDTVIVITESGPRSRTGEPGTFHTSDTLILFTRDGVFKEICTF
jgi:dihydroxyacid dehydratase/phosphogluconate dehydratase